MNIFPFLLCLSLLFFPQLFFLRHPFFLFAFLFLGDGFDLHLLYNAMKSLSIVLQAFCVSDLIPWIYNCKVFGLGHTHSSVLAWRIPGLGEPAGLPSMGLHRVGHHWSDLAAAAAAYLNGLVVFPTLFNFSLNLAIRISWPKPQSAPGLVFSDCIELLHLWLQRI